MIPKTQNKGGFSIIELLVATVATAIMALAIGSVLIYVWMGWSKSSDSIEMQRDASLAMRTMAKEIRQANTVDDGNPLTCTSLGRTVVFATSGRDLNMTIDSGTPMVLVRGIVNSFASREVGVRSVQVSLSLDTGTDNSSVGMTISRRN